MINVGDKVKCVNSYTEIAKGEILTVSGVQFTFDGKEFLHFKEKQFSYNSEDFEKC
jgi:hypothetical protein